VETPVGIEPTTSALG